MARRIVRAVVAACAFLTLAVASDVAFPACPPSIQTALASPLCVAVNGSTTDNCVRSIRKLLLEETATSSVLPCTASVKTADTDNSHASSRRDRRRLANFSGKLKCKLSAPIPFDATNWDQTFILDCKEQTSYAWIWWVLGVVAFILVLALVGSLWDRAKNWYEARRGGTQEPEPTTSTSAIDAIEAQAQHDAAPVQTEYAKA